MKHITLILVALFTFNFVGGQTNLAKEDIAIIGVNTDNEDFTVLLRTDITAGTTIYFSDNEVNASGTGLNNSNEGIVLFTASVDYSCGTVLSFITNSSEFTIVDNTFQLANNTGEVVLAFQGYNSSTLEWTTFLHANTQPGITLPTGFTTADIVDGSADNREYIGSKSIPSWADLNNISNYHESNNYSAVTLNTTNFTCSPCSSTVTWSAGAWSNGTGPDLTTAAIISDDFDTGNGGNETSFSACSLTVNSGAILTVNNNTFIEVENDVTVDGEIFVASSGNFVQNDDTGSFSLGASGVARVNKVTPFKSKWYYYTYWSSPVVDETIEDAFPLVDGDRRFWFNAANFKDTDGDDVDEEGDDWQYAYRNDTMIPGVGYASTEARSFGGPFGGGSTGTATFEGEFNTGDVSVLIDFDPTNPGMKWNFIGNPYPSAIDFDLFFAENSGIVEGAAYFWSQASPPSSSNAGNQQLNFSTNDYAMYASGSGLGTAGASGSIPNNFVPSAQGFFIEGNTIGTAKFTNAMRVASTTSNNLFFKGSTKSQKTSTRDPLENRIWINLTSDNGVFNQIAVAYVENATHNDDGSAFDAVRIVTKETPAALYSIIENCDKKFAIQGKNINSINEDETITLGFKTKIKVATLYSLSIAKMEGDFLNSHSVFVKDKLLNKVHDLTVCDYTFTSETGEFNNRFEIVFKADALSTTDISADPSLLKIVELDNDNVQFTAPNGLGIKTVSVFDLFGRQLYQFNGQNDTEVFNLSNLSSAVFVAKVELSNGTVISKKAIKK
ncbi:T9SS type A sorting domain-containing protein [Tamlana crocina]|uniref:T9SS type A sorting domain-containing protein n=1 Tax=Tamlana crocina TaxID=393006 RepID=A0ABX1DD51_9FLAO|nr:T9SS type A sorting domain-containing protein [Tamlana crocina]NJX16002.1 T9SS type A sorting domain-containing protein [Tamlana crocina]